MKKIINGLIREISYLSQTKISEKTEELNIQYKYLSKLTQAQISNWLNDKTPNFSISGRASVAFAILELLKEEDKYNFYDEVKTLESIYLFEKSLKSSLTHQPGEDVYPYYESAVHLHNLNEIVEEMDDFFLRESPKNPFNLSLNGGPKTGKTYAINFLFDYIFTKLTKKVIPIKITFTKDDNDFDVFSDKLIEKIKFDINTYIDLDFKDNYSHLSDFLQDTLQRLHAVKETKYYLVLLVDYDVPQKNTFNSFMVELHSFHNRNFSEENYLSLIFTYNQFEISRLDLNYSASTLLSASESFFLKPLDELSLENFLEKVDKIDYQKAKKNINKEFLNNIFLTDVYIRNINDNRAFEYVKKAIKDYYISPFQQFLDDDKFLLMSLLKNDVDSIFSNTIENTINQTNTGIKKEFSLNSSINRENQIYIEREADEVAFRLLRDGYDCNIHAGRQCGKTSLMNYLIERLSENVDNYIISFELTNFFHAKNFLNGLQEIINKIGKIIPTFEYKLDAKREISIQFSEVLEIISQISKKKIYLFLDEFDVLLKYSYSEFSGILFGIRTFNNNYNGDNRVITTIISVLTPYQMLENYESGGITINSFEEITLNNFSLEDSKILLQLQEQDGFNDMKMEDSEYLIKELLDFSGGQPYIFSKIGYKLQQEEANKRKDLFVDIKNSILSDGSFLSSHLEGIDHQIKSNEHNSFIILDTYKDIYHGINIIEYNKKYADYLINIGIVKKRDDKFIISNPIYRRFLNDNWIDSMKNLFQSTLTADIQRQKKISRDASKNVAIVYCGGTIGMLMEGSKATFQGAVQKINEYLHSIDFVNPHFIKLNELDGIDVTYEDWIRFAKFIYEHYHDYDGFIFLHGTDTLAYSANAVSFMLGDHLDKPVIFTGSQTTFDIEYGDGKQNIVRACYAAAHPNAIKEVQILFNDEILRAVKSEKVDDRLFTGFKSANYPELAHITRDLLINEYALLSKNQKDKKEINFRPYFCKDILFITLVPGTNPNLYEGTVTASLHSKDKIKGIILTTPGAGSIPTKDEYNFRAFIEKMTKIYQIPVLIASQMPINPYTAEEYKASSFPSQIGAIPAGNLTIISAYIKFGWTLGIVEEEIKNEEIRLEERVKRMKELMSEDYVGESIILQSIAKGKQNEQK